MKKCFNCQGINRDSDNYCRNCGYVMKNSTYYILINIFTFLAFICLIGVIALFIASYFAY